MLQLQMTIKLLSLSLSSLFKRKCAETLGSKRPRFCTRLYFNTQSLTGILSIFFAWCFGVHLEPISRFTNKKICKNLLYNFTTIKKQVLDKGFKTINGFLLVLLIWRRKNKDCRFTLTFIFRSQFEQLP